MKGRRLTALIMAVILSLSCMTVKAFDITDTKGDNSRYSQTENENSGGQNGSDASQQENQVEDQNSIQNEGDNQPEDTIQNAKEELKPAETEEEPSLYASSGEMMEMPAGQKMAIVLAEDTTYCWNADGNGGHGQQIQLYPANGPNKCILAFPLCWQS